MKVVLESGGGFEGFNRKLQLKVLERDSEPDAEGYYAVKKIMIVLKWGGELSYLGYGDAMDLGMKMRQERYDDDHDFLSLYSSYKHDLKTYSSDEGRCIKTAAAFLKGFLNISGGLAPIITSMVNFTKKAQSTYQS
jgi:inositol hexakisphosphate/diphosphoinositol-pentakisphosphate kinase